MQGKTTELQSLDSQPTFGDMLDKRGKVQFNLSAKRRIAAAGVDVKSSSKRKQKAFAYLSRKMLFEGAKPKKCMAYTSFREQQKEAHRKGVQDGQGLFEKYMPRSCLTLLQENGYWNFPYKFEHPCGLQIVDGQLPPNYNKLDVDVTSGSLVDVTEKDLGEEDDKKECDYLFDSKEISNNHPVLEDFKQDEEQAALPKR